MARKPGFEHQEQVLQPDLGTDEHLEVVHNKGAHKIRRAHAIGAGTFGMSNIEGVLGCRGQPTGLPGVEPDFFRFVLGQFDVMDHRSEGS